MKKNKALTYITAVLTVSFLYSITYFFIPMKEMGEICLASTTLKDGSSLCVINMSLIFISFYMFLPLITALVLQKFVYKEPVKEIGFYFKWSPWYFFALLLPIAAVYMSIGTGMLMPGVEYAPDMSGLIERYKDAMPPEQLELMRQQLENPPPYMLLLGLVQMLVAAVTINAVFALGEEAGWRGFLLKSLDSFSFYKKSLIIGTVWGVWHFPVIIQGYNFPQHPLAGVFVMIVFCILYTPLLIYAVNKTGSVFAAAVMHGAINASAGVGVMYLKGGNDLLVGALGLSGIIILMLLNIGLFVYDRYYTKENLLSW